MNAFQGWLARLAVRYLARVARLGSDIQIIGDQWASGTDAEFVIAKIPGSGKAGQS